MALTVPWVPDRAEIIFINHNPVGGENEIPDEHPMLVITNRTFNERTGIVIGFPMTHSNRHEDNLLALKIRKKASEPPSYVLCFQPKSFDWRDRNARPHPWGTGNHSFLKDALALLDDICLITDTVKGNHV